MKVQDKTRKIHLVNTTDEIVFFNISADSNPYRGLTVKPGRTSICICAFNARKLRTHSKHFLDVTLVRRPYDVPRNNKVSRIVNTILQEEIYLVESNTGNPASLFKLSAGNLFQIPGPDSLFPYSTTDWICPRTETFRISFWECRSSKYGPTIHWWVNIPNCDCLELDVEANQEIIAAEMESPCAQHLSDRDDYPHAYAMHTIIDFPGTQWMNHH